MEDQIKRFQASSGLVPDGIAGSMTLIHINSRLNLGVPRLMGAN
ncbi:peptidoglycan-binding protein [Oleiphilus sp. HI0043]|nr:peptidoglycan-binding domain-containing protein [Oleiphilus sp. HI0043]